MADILIGGDSSVPVLSGAAEPVLLAPEGPTQLSIFDELDAIVGRVDARRASSSSSGVVLEAGA